MPDPNNVVDAPLMDSARGISRSIIGGPTPPLAATASYTPSASNGLILLGVVWAVCGSGLLYWAVTLIWSKAPGIAPSSATTGISPDQSALGLGLVGILGALGGYIRCLHTFTRCFSQRTSLLEWAISTFLTPLKSSLLALVAALLVVAGLINLTSKDADGNWMGIYALAALVGLFANEAVSKLEEVFKTLFGTTQKLENTNHRPAANGTEPPSPNV